MIAKLVTIPECLEWQEHADSDSFRYWFLYYTRIRRFEVANLQIVEVIDTYMYRLQDYT